MVREAVIGDVAIKRKACNWESIGNWRDLSGRWAWRDAVRGDHRRRETRRVQQTVQRGRRGRGVAIVNLGLLEAL